MSKDTKVKVTFHNGSTQISKFNLNCWNCRSIYRTFPVPTNADRVTVSFSDENDRCSFCFKHEKKMETSDDDDDEYYDEDYSFKELKTVILELFEKRKGHSYGWVKALGGYAFTKKENLTYITEFIGDLNNFRDWLEPKLDEFFKTFYARHFRTSNEKMNHRRHSTYGDIVDDKICQTAEFKRAMVTDLDHDRYAFLMGNYADDTECTQEGRRLVFFKSIRNYIHRLFVTNQYSVPY